MRSEETAAFDRVLAREIEVIHARRAGALQVSADGDEPDVLERR